jgi:DNA replication protein DnaC
VTIDPAHPDSGCVKCRGSGKIFEREREFAVAQVCSCLGTCPACGGSGRTVVQIRGIEGLAPCGCQNLIRRVGLFNQAHIPARHAFSTLDNFDVSRSGGPAEAHRMSGHWSQSYVPGVENRGLVLHGRVGRGKTHLMVGVLHRLVFTHAVPVRFVEFSHLLVALKAGFSTRQSSAALLDPLLDVEVLAIDELGKGRCTDWELAVVDELISRRYNAMATVIATTNYAPELKKRRRPGDAAMLGPANLSVASGDQFSLGERIGERVLSRLMEMAELQEVRGVDYRERRGR